MSSAFDVQDFYKIFKDISLILHSSAQLDEVFELVVWKAAEAFKAKGALLRSYNYNTNLYEVTAVYGMPDRYISKGPVSTEKILTDEIKKKKPLIIKDIWKSTRVQYPEWTWKEGVRMIVDTPLFLGNELVAVLRLYFKETRNFLESELNFLLAIGTQCACAINNIRLLETKQDQFEQLAIQTEKLSALGRMAAGIAHEINNPLAGILLYSTHMKKKLTKESQLRQNLEVIISETTRCKSTVQELLEFSREREPMKSTCDINLIIRQALDILENELYLKHIDMHVELSENIEELMVDANQIEQVLVNLLLNSIQALEKKKGLIKIKTMMDSARENVLIDIEDNGSGISRENMDKIFEPFFTTKPKGTGLGMSVSYGIIRNHKGDIKVLSQKGVGTKFSIKIPVKDSGENH